MGERLGGRGEAEDVLTVGISRTIEHDHRGADDLLVVVEEEGNTGC